MSKCLFPGFLLILACCPPRCLGAGTDDRPATHTAAQLTESLCKQYQLLQGLAGLEVQYRMATDHLERRSNQAWRWRWAELTNIIKPTEPGKIYVQYRYPEKYTDPKTKVEKVRVETQIDSSDGEAMAHVEPAVPGRPEPAEAAITSRTKLPNYNTHYRSFYFRFISYPVAPDPDLNQPPRERYRAEDYWLPWALVKNREAYRVRPELERVDGVSCHVLERPRLDVMWIQTEPTLLLRRRQFHWKEGGPIRQLATFRNHKEVSKGVWLPLELDLDRYAAPWEDADLHGKAAYRIRLTVSRLVAEAVPDSRFRAEIPKGAVVSTEDNRRFINQPGFDPYEEARKSLPPVRTRTKWLLLMAALVLSAILASLCWQIWKIRAASSRQEQAES